MRRKYRLLLQALLVAIGLLIGMRAALYAAAETQAQPDPGLVIIAVDPDGPAAAAGVARGDILLAIGESNVNTLTDLAAALAKAEAGATVTLHLQRGDQVQEIQVETATRNGRAYLGILPYGAPDMAKPGPHIWQQPMNPPALPPLAVAAMPQVVVMDVLTDSAAAAAGIMVNDVITAVDGEAVVKPQSLQAQVAQLAPGDVITLTITRGAEEPQDIAVTLGEGADGQAQIGVQLGVIVSGQIAGEEGQFLPRMEQGFRVEPPAPDKGERRFFWPHKPGAGRPWFFHFWQWLASFFHFFAAHHPVWMMDETLIPPAGESTLAYPAQPDYLIITPPLFAEEGAVLEQGAPAPQGTEGFY